MFLSECMYFVYFTLSPAHIASAASEELGIVCKSICEWDWSGYCCFPYFGRDKGYNVRVGLNYFNGRRRRRRQKEKEKESAFQKELPLLQEKREEGTKSKGLINLLA